MAKEKKTIKAKTLSKVFKIVSAVGSFICSVIKWLGLFPDASINEIIWAWVAVYGVGAGTIDANIIIDKFKGSSNAAEETEEEE